MIESSKFAGHVQMSPVNFAYSENIDIYANFGLEDRAPIEHPSPRDKELLLGVLESRGHGGKNYREQGPYSQ